MMMAAGAHTGCSAGRHADQISAGVCRHHSGSKLPRFPGLQHSRQGRVPGHRLAHDLADHHRQLRRPVVVRRGTTGRRAAMIAGARRSRRSARFAAALSRCSRPRRTRRECALRKRRGSITKRDHANEPPTLAGERRAPNIRLGLARISEEAVSAELPVMRRLARRAWLCVGGDYAVCAEWRSVALAVEVGGGGREHRYERCGGEEHPGDLPRGGMSFHQCALGGDQVADRIDADDGL